MTRLYQESCPEIHAGLSKESQLVAFTRLNLLSLTDQYDEAIKLMDELENAELEDPYIPRRYIEYLRKDMLTTRLLEQINP